MKSAAVAVVLGGALLHVFVLYATWWGAMDGEARRSRIYFADGGNGMYAILGLGALGLLAVAVLGVRFALRPNARSWPLFVAPFLALLLGEALERRAVAKALEAFQTPASWAQQAPNLAETVHAASATSTLGLIVASTLLGAATWPFAARSLNGSAARKLPAVAAGVLVVSALTILAIRFGLAGDAAVRPPPTWWLAASTVLALGVAASARTPSGQVPTIGALGMSAIGLSCVTRHHLGMVWALSASGTDVVRPSHKPEVMARALHQLDSAPSSFVAFAVPVLLASGIVWLTDPARRPLRESVGASAFGIAVAAVGAVAVLVPRARDIARIESWSTSLYPEDLRPIALALPPRYSGHAHRTIHVGARDVTVVGDAPPEVVGRSSDLDTATCTEIVIRARERLGPNELVHVSFDENTTFRRMYCVALGLALRLPREVSTQPAPRFEISSTGIERGPTTLNCLGIARHLPFPRPFDLLASAEIQVHLQVTHTGEPSWQHVHLTADAWQLRIGEARSEARGSPSERLEALKGKLDLTKTLGITAAADVRTSDVLSVVSAIEDGTIELDLFVSPERGLGHAVEE